MNSIELGDYGNTLGISLLEILIFSILARTHLIVSLILRSITTIDIFELVL